ncbi:MAG TPA: hypothetical protein VFL13_05920 [Candidatus Baltobacteraceae bacterium]|nr:hypothetical protein [Candidatus Baltobacteraceae bacterium]
MKIVVPIVLTVILSGSAAAAATKTATGTIPVTIQLVNGSTVGAYVIGGNLLTTVQNDSAADAAPHGAPIVRVSFQMERSWHLVKRVTWDKAHQHLTIDF